MSLFADARFTLGNCTRRGLLAGGAAFLALPIERGSGADWIVGNDGRGHHNPRLISTTTTAAQPSTAAAPAANPMPVKVTKPPELKRIHRGSARHWFEKGTADYIGRPVRALLLDIEERMLGFGYPNGLHFSVPEDDAALVVPFERIDSDGSPLRVDDRFNVEPTTRLTLLGRKPIPRHLRATAFFLTAHPLLTGPSPMSFSRHRRALEAGMRPLGEGMHTALITPQHRLTALIYEYYAEAAEEPKFVEHSQWRGIDHLKKSLWQD